MLIQTIASSLRQDLLKLRKEIELYENEKNIWKVQGNISNSAGNLCLHLVGNLNTYIGQQIGKTGYLRNRDQEFSLKNIPRQELLNKIDETINVVDSSLAKLSEADLEKEYPLLVYDKMTSTEYMLVHLSTHLGYHLGQVNYHRRLIDG
ncbi:MAG TPA: DUF1572 family protein [Flavitalea sp.]|nr:DUF1572 family protein [Flavitalea sp.]